jgi:hypothetical protein
MTRVRRGHSSQATVPAPALAYPVPRSGRHTFEAAGAAGGCKCKVRTMANCRDNFLSDRERIVKLEAQERVEVDSDYFVLAR